MRETTTATQTTPADEPVDSEVSAMRKQFSHVLPTSDAFKAAYGYEFRDYELATLASGLRMWAYGGDFLVPPSWMSYGGHEAHEFLETPTAFSRENLSNGKRFRSIAHGWFISNAFWSSVSGALSSEQSNCAEASYCCPKDWVDRLEPRLARLCF